ncbi:hypothetical protein PspLS_08508 [Pyricularia sp. CBS 133598]|nr:hypothetical protein PspLS_08508 [Pyricularia sp. CBS 133598]
MGSKSSKVARRPADPSDRISSRDNNRYGNLPRGRPANPSHQSYQHPESDWYPSGPPPRIPGSSPAESAARASPAPSYDFEGEPSSNHDPNAKTWIYAREARAQAAKTRQENPRHRGYPSRYGNKPDSCPLTVAPPTAGDYYLHAPLIPGQTDPYINGQKPGGVRAVYNRNDQTHFDVIQHDPRKPQTASGAHQFTLRPYVPAATRPLHR